MDKYVMYNMYLSGENREVLLPAPGHDGSLKDSKTPPKGTQRMVGWKGRLEYLKKQQV